MRADRRGAAFRIATALCFISGLAGCSVINYPPSVALISDQTVSIGERLSVEFYGQDPDGDPLSWTVTGLGEDAEVIQLTAPTDDDPTQPSRALLVWSPTLQDLESNGNIYQVVVDADDDEGGVATQSFTVTVNDAYGAPRRGCVRRGRTAAARWCRAP